MKMRGSTFSVETNTHAGCVKKSKGLLETHHVIWRSQGGGDSPENLLTLCAKCHAKVHNKTKTDKKVRELFKGMCKRQVHTTLLNSIMPEFHKWLSSNFQKITVTYGYETKQKRYELGLPKQTRDRRLLGFSTGGKGSRRH